MLKRSHYFTLGIMPLVLLLSGCKIALLNPKGMIAASEKHILITAVCLMLIVVIPVIIISFIFAWRYRASANNKTPYCPNWSHSNTLEFIWWSIPCIIIAILATITWISSHRLDPYRPLTIGGKPLTIEAISLNWKWLFIYPKQHIATINYVEIPVHRQIQFLITSDAPMNSLEIPQLAGQIYAMTGMQTKLHLIANQPGHYAGLSTSFSGNGFSGMTFTVHATSAKQFKIWAKKVRQTARPLTPTLYQHLTKPSENNPVAYFSAPPSHLFSKVIMKYMKPAKTLHHASNTHCLDLDKQTKLMNKETINKYSNSRQRRRNNPGAQIFGKVGHKKE